MKTVMKETGEIQRIERTDIDREIERLERMARFFDTAFKIPVIGVRVGWDSILGLIPGIGDALGVAPLAYYLKVARTYRLGTRVYLRLMWNQGVDFALGLIPILGDLIDVGWKANLMNAQLLTKALRAKAGSDV